MRLSEILSKAAKEQAERQRQTETGHPAASHRAGRNKVWDAFHAACEFVPSDPVGVAAWKWANLIIEACAQLKAAGEANRLEAMRYDGTDPRQMAGNAAAYRVCQIACTGKLPEVIEALRGFMETQSSRDSSFRLYLESVRDNRRLWATGSAVWH
jgi:hypothetical protein